MGKYNIPKCFYRISIKALILDEEKRFLLCRETNGKWDLPGGGLDYGEQAEIGLAREIQEEMGLEVKSMSDAPTYVTTSLIKNTFWVANLIYVTKLKDLDFTPSNECTEIKFFTKEEAMLEDVISNVKDFCNIYDPNKH